MESENNGAAEITEADFATFDEGWGNEPAGETAGSDAGETGTMAADSANVGAASLGGPSPDTQPTSLDVVRAGHLASPSPVMQPAPFNAVGADDHIGPSRDDFLAFIREFPDVKAKDIPASVWAQVRSGANLTMAYARHRLRDQEVELKNYRNRERAAGSAFSAGGGVTRLDPFDQGWDEF